MGAIRYSELVIGAAPAVDASAKVSEISAVASNRVGAPTMDQPRQAAYCA
ncbi:hypothetical protein [Ancylobacter aquaticus]|nr:hypothetical protein [Ancylobacter aquaticus]